MLGKLLFSIVLLIIAGCLGLAGNCSLIWLFMKSKVKLNFHRLMITLAIYDIILVSLCMIVFALPEISEAYTSEGYHSHIAPKAVAVIQLSLTGSIYCTVCISIERYLTVCHPFYLSRKKWSAKRYIIPTILFSILYNITRFFETRLEYIGLEDQTRENNTILIENDGNQETQYKYEIKYTSLRQNKYYYSIYTVGCNFLFNGLIPFSLIISLNVSLYRRLKQIWKENPRESIASLGSRKGSTKRRIKLNELELAKVSLIVMFVFVVCNSIRWIPNIYELLQRLHHDEGEEKDIKWPAWVDFMIHVNHFLTVFNSSVNFYIYYFTHYGIPVKSCKSKSYVPPKASDQMDMDVIMSGRFIEASVENENFFLREANC